MRYYPSQQPRSFNLLQHVENHNTPDRTNINGCDADISDFKVVKEISRGDGGAVLRALWLRKNRYVVLKERMFSELGKSKLVYHEASMLQSLAHENVVSCYGWFWKQHGKSVYIILECADNGDLHHFLKQRRDSNNFLKEEQVWYILYGLCRGLYHIHSKQALHRDIKPLNCFITSDYKFKLGDFGISRQCSDQTVLLQTFSCGTPLYMSPEIIEHVPYNQKTDCWSLGVLLYDITTLSHPFYDRGKESFSIRDLIDRIASCSYTRISTLMAEKKIPDIYSNHLSNVVDNLLKKDYERRWSCKNVLDYIAENNIQVTSFNINDGYKKDKIVQQVAMVDKAPPTQVRPQTARPRIETTLTVSKTVPASPKSMKEPQNTEKTAPVERRDAVNDRDKRWEMRKQQRLEKKEVRVTDERVNHVQSTEKLKATAEKILKQVGEPYLPTSKREKTVSVYSSLSSVPSQNFMSDIGKNHVVKSKRNDDLFGKRRYNIFTGAFE